MQKLRDLYKETQRNANDNFDKVTHERMKKIHGFASKQYETSARNNDLANLDELSFYRQKFKAVVQTFNDSIQQGYKKSKIQSEIKNILQQNFEPLRQPQQYNASKEKIENQPASPTLLSLAPRDLVQSYFQDKNKEINRSKVGFKSVLEGIPYAPKKFPIKSQQHLKVSESIPPNNAEQIKVLQTQIEKLRKQLQQKDVQKSFNMEVLQIEKKQYEQRIQDLCRQVEALSFQNVRLKEESVKSYPIQNYSPNIYEEQIIQQQAYNPYRIKYRENNINKIQNKQGKDAYSIKYEPLTSPKTYNHPIKEESEDSKLKSQNLELINELEKNVDQSKRKISEDVLNTSFYKFNKSAINNDAKVFAIKSKISFFKSSMIIYRGNDYQIALKSSEIVPLQVKKISIYVNNKSKDQKSINLQYKFDSAYYQLKVNKKLSGVERNSQGKEEVEVKLINSNDLDSLIEVKMTINASEVIFLLPAMFLEFIEKRPIYQKTKDYALQKVTPISQFASLHSTEEYIPLEKLYGEHYQAGRVYAISKNHEGYINFKWDNGQVEIETIPAWRLFLSYLMLRDY